MSELRTILRQADQNSLVLGDELCSGTESTSAKSIFVAGLLQLTKKGCSSIFATHLHEITEYEEIRALESNGNLSMKHMEVIYNKEKDVLVYNRKLRDGAGGNMYGLEVCKSLSLPEDFLEEANQIRMKYHPESASIFSLKTSHSNRKKLMHMCEECGVERAIETHHIVQQKEAGDDGFIQREDGSVFHKNHVANLRALCELCHRKIHL
jgi:DNA mismatch repair protein MutS